jgi:hypothetical protein
VILEPKLPNVCFYIIVVLDIKVNMLDPESSADDGISKHYAPDHICETPFFNLAL